MTDYTSTATVKTYLGGTSTADDTLIATIVTAASRFLDSYCGRTLVAGNSAAYTFDWQHPQRLFLSPYEFATVTAVTNGDGSALAIGTEVRTMPRTRGQTDPITWLEALIAGSKFFQPSSTGGGRQDAITVTGRLGMLAAADELLAFYATKIAAHLYRIRDTGAEKSYVPELGQTIARQALTDAEFATLNATYRKVLVA